MSVKTWIRIVFAIQAIAIAYGLYSDLAPTSWQFIYMVKGMGIALSVISATMMLVLATVDLESRTREAQASNVLVNAIAQRVSVSLPFHEREFFALWPEQVKRAQNTVDVAYLSPRPPNATSGAEGEYFSALSHVYKSSTAHVRRVERLTEAKVDWIHSLVSQFNGIQNISLAIYRDPLESDHEMPAPLTVCRVDDRYAWLVAIAEHQSTGRFRDVLLTGRDVVDLISKYFQERLWDRSTVIIERGKVLENWEAEILE